MNYIMLHNAFGTWLLKLLCHIICKMGGKGALTKIEKSKIIQGLNKRQLTLEISKIIGRNYCAVKKFANKPELCNGRSDKGKLQKSTCVLHQAPNLIK